MPGLRPSTPPVASRHPAEQEGARWLLLIHQIPPKPDYLRVKIGRRLQRVGAIAIKNSVYALPSRSESREDFQWIVREIHEAGGDAFFAEARLHDGLTDEAVRKRFDAARNEDYADILAAANTLLKAARSAAKATGATTRVDPDGRPGALAHELTRLRRQYESASAIDFFGAPGRAPLAAALAAIGDVVRPVTARPRNLPHTAPHDGETWVTRRDVHVDRIGSAWLIQRFVDHHPRFRFVDPATYVHRKGEYRFDMFDAEYTHVGDACTFETLASTFAPDDLALRDVAEMVHDIDCKDTKFGRDEAPGLARMIGGIVARYATDEDRVRRGAELFETLYAACCGAPRA